MSLAIGYQSCFSLLHICKSCHGRQHVGCPVACLVPLAALVPVPLVTQKLTDKVCCRLDSCILISWHAGALDVFDSKRDVLHVGIPTATKSKTCQVTTSQTTATQSPNKPTDQLTSQPPTGHRTAKGPRRNQGSPVNLSPGIEQPRD